MSVMAMVVLVNIENIQEVVVWLVDSIITEQTLINVTPQLPDTWILTRIDHPGYFGKVGMRYFHERKVCNGLENGIADV
jgi:hypothetical protein